MPYRNPKRQRRYQREWLRRRRAEWIASQGGACARCGRTDWLEVDHIDPTTKVDHRVWSWSEERRVPELAKCQVLCKRCHGIKARRVA